MGGSPKLPRRIKDTSEIDAEREKEAARERLRLARGRASTILTGGLGDVSQANIGRAVLTGQ